MNEPGLRRMLPEQFSGSGHTFGTSRHPSVTNPILSKRVCFYKSGDPQFNGLRMVINNRTFKTFEALLDSLSKKVPLPFGVRNITTPRGVHAVSSLDELEDGKSYICSDHRKVKPINLAVARKKPPPWYNARPVSSRRRTVQKARQNPGYKFQEPMVMRTPKKLLIFRNGDPSTKCVVVLQKKTTTTFESILKYISELMQFRVAKLHTPDGRRVDGLPALIMCSGTVVAAGREKFKPENYNSQKSVLQTRTRSNRKGLRRLKGSNHKKRSFALKPRILSPSSEQYIVNQIRNSIAESSCSFPTNSHEMESSHLLESVAESEENFLGEGVEGQDCLLPTDDDIEKSFRVNQDGSMTVEMKVRLTIKEEETIHWTTTLSRSSVPNQLIEDCLPPPEPEQEISIPESDHMDLRPPTASNKDTTHPTDICNEDSPSFKNGPNNEGSFEEDIVKAHEDLVLPLRTPTPGQKQFRTKQASMESVTSLTVEGLQEDIIGSYFREQIGNGDITEQYCMVKQTNSRPVPKPRKVGSVESNNCNITAYKSAEMTEISQVDSSGEEITETVMHIYEQQTCQDNFLANFCAQAMSTSVNFSRPATANTGHLSLNGNFQQELCRPSTASEPASLWRSESISLKSDLTLQSENTGSTDVQPLSQKPHSQMKKKVKNVKKASPKHKVTAKRLKSPGNKAKTSSNKKVKPITSDRFISKNYGNNPIKKDKTEIKKRKNQFESNTTSAYQSAKNKSKLDITEPRARQQAALDQTKGRQKSLRATKHVKENMPLPVMSDSGTTGYVEDWLEKAESKPSFYFEEENNPLINSEKVNLENDPCLMSVAEKVKSLKDKSKTSNSSSAPVSELTRNGSVKQKIRSFEHKSDDRKHSDKNSENLSASNYISSTSNTTDLSLNKSASITVQFEEGSNSLLMDLPPPPHESLLESSCAHRMEASGASSPLYRLSSVSDIHPFSTSPTSDRAISPTDHTMEMASSIQADNSSEMRDALLQRAPSIKRTPLVSNLSFERKMSLKKASLDEYTIPKETTSLPINTVPNNALGKSTDRASERLKSKSITDSKSSQSYVSSVSPASLKTDHRTSSTSVLSIETPQKQSNEESLSPKPKVKKVKLVGSPAERRQNIKSSSSDIMNKSPRIPPINNNPANKKASPNVERKKSATPSASPASEKRQIQSKSKLLKKTSPYSQSLDLTSPPAKHKTVRKSLHRNLSTDSALAASVKTSRTPSPKRAAQGLQLKQSNKTNPEECVQIQGTLEAKTDDNLNIKQLIRTELVENILDVNLKTNDNEDVAHNKARTIAVEEEDGACEMNKQQTEHLVSSENSVTETDIVDTQCYVELNVSKPRSRQYPDSESETTSLSDADRKHSVYSSGIEVPCSVDDTGTDIDDLSFSEEDLQNETKELKVIVEEPLSDEEQEADSDLTVKKQQIENVDIHSDNDSGHDQCSCLEQKTNKDITSRHEELNSDDVLLSEDENIENIAKKLCDEVISQSVADRVTCFEEKGTNNLKTISVSMCPSRRKTSVVSDGEESPAESHMSQPNPGTRSAPQSSLSFSYDSSGVITKQPEGNRVKSIREMFLVKSTTDPKQSSCQNSGDVTELRAETSVSGGYQSQTSSELSSGEDDSSRKSIKKGFVMRTIERLYGKKETPAQLDKMDRPLSAEKEKKKDQTSIFSPFHAARSKTVSELSYFNSSNALDTLTEATRCIAFNAQVGPADSVLIDNGQWLLQDSTVLRKSVSDPVAISQNLTRSAHDDLEPCKDKEEKTPYLLFKTDSEDEQKSLSRKCTYFSLPHGSDSEAVQEESAVKGDIKSDCSESMDNPDSTKMKSEKNGKLSGVSDFKIMDNKVHPLVEAPSEGETVVVQPARGQGALNRRLQEPDMLDFLYNFCGENCPIL